MPALDLSAGPQFEIKNKIPFANHADYKVLRNDWPYGLEKGITHICVWLKDRLPVREDNGDLTDEGRAMVVAYVQRAFVKKLGLDGKDQVLWFKNWVGLQSVRGLEHIHVLVRNVEEKALAVVLESGEDATTGKQISR
jgi:Protein of unknown function (DUF3605)